MFLSSTMYTIEIVSLPHGAVGCWWVVYNSDISWSNLLTSTVKPVYNGHSQTDQNWFTRSIIA